MKLLGSSKKEISKDEDGEYIIKKHETITDENSPINIYVNKTEFL